MNIITADFNWISFLIIVVAAIIGVVRSNAKKQSPKPVFNLPDFQEQEEEDQKIEEEYTEPVYVATFETQQEEVKLPGDYYREPKETLQEESPVHHALEEEGEEEERHAQFDIRQAIISSEILRRPQF